MTYLSQGSRFQCPSVAHCSIHVCHTWETGNRKIGHQDSENQQNEGLGRRETDHRLRSVGRGSGIMSRSWAKIYRERFLIYPQTFVMGSYYYTWQDVPNHWERVKVKEAEIWEGRGTSRQGSFNSALSTGFKEVTITFSPSCLLWK